MIQVVFVVVAVCCLSYVVCWLFFFQLPNRLRDSIHEPFISMMCVQVWQLSDMSLNDKVQPQKGWEKTLPWWVSGYFPTPCFFFFSDVNFCHPKPVFLGAMNNKLLIFQRGDFSRKITVSPRMGVFHSQGWHPARRPTFKLATIVFQPSNHPFSGCFCGEFQGGVTSSRKTSRNLIVKSRVAKSSGDLS